MQFILHSRLIILTRAGLYKMLETIANIRRIYMYIYICIYIYIHIHIHIYTHTHAHTYTCTYMHIYISTKMTNAVVRSILLNSNLILFCDHFRGMYKQPKLTCFIVRALLLTNRLDLKGNVMCRAHWATQTCVPVQLCTWRRCAKQVYAPDQPCAKQMHALGKLQGLAVPSRCMRLISYIQGLAVPSGYVHLISYVEVLAVTSRCTWSMSSTATTQLMLTDVRFWDNSNKELDPPSDFLHK